MTIPPWHIRCRRGAVTSSRPFIAQNANRPEDIALVLATAGHALDYDDVHLVSVTHPSIVIVPALLALGAAESDKNTRAKSALAIGAGVNIALGHVLGYGHYDHGWHATSTIGTIAAAAACAYFLALDEAQTRNAIGLAAAQSGGLQRNFGTMAKPLHAGFAAAAGVRSVRLARQGVSASEDIFSGRGFFSVFAGEQGIKNPQAIDITPETSSLSRKLFPCCYQTHRIIEAGLKVKRALPNALPADVSITLDVPFGTMRPLHIMDPATGLEGKFCAAYTLAVALGTGKVSLTDFEDAAILRPDIRQIMSKITIREATLDGPMPTGIEHGTVELTIMQGNRLLARSEVSAFPGSPADPASPERMQDKIHDCLTHYNQTAKAPIAPPELSAWLCSATAS